MIQTLNDGITESIIGQHQFEKNVFVSTQIEEYLFLRDI